MNKQLDRELIRSSQRYGIGPGNWGKKRDHSKPDLEKQMLLKMFSLIMMDRPVSIVSLGVRVRIYMGLGEGDWDYGLKIFLGMS